MRVALVARREQQNHQLRDSQAQIADLEGRLRLAQSSLDIAATMTDKLEQERLQLTEEVSSQRRACAWAEDSSIRERADADWQKKLHSRAVDNLRREVDDHRWRLERSQTEKSMLHHQLHTLEAAGLFVSQVEVRGNQWGGRHFRSHRLGPYKKLVHAPVDTFTTAELAQEMY